MAESSTAGAQVRVFVRSCRNGRKPRGRGFTLIELMIVTAIVAILAAVAYPSYQSHLRKGYRAAAQSFMMDLAQKQTQYLADNRQYAATPAALNATAPTDVSNRYTIIINVVPGPPPGYTIVATPIAGTDQAKDGALSLDQSGQKTPSDKW